MRVVLIVAAVALIMLVAYLPFLSLHPIVHHACWPPGYREDACRHARLVR